MSFTVAKWLERNHLIEYGPDMALNPPQSYLLVQDFLILSCAIIYCFCYLFYTIRTKRDRYLAGPIDALFGNIAYELYFPFVVASSWLQRVGCLVWFLLDVRFTYTAIKYACAPEKRAATVIRTIFSVVVSIILFRILGQYFPDDGEQLTAYWAGWVLELPVGWLSVWLLYKDEHTRGQSLEIWLMRLFGIFTAISVFAWRYINVPQNWGYVASWPSIALLTGTIIPEFVYPFAYWRAERLMEAARHNAKAKAQ